MSVMHAAAVRKLAGEVTAFEEGLPSDALGMGGPTWPHDRRRRWRALLKTTTRLPDVSALAWDASTCSTSDAHSAQVSP